jgi:NitT/TauT family transport system ATP-binding protein
MKHSYLEFRHVKKTFKTRGASVEALDDVSFTVNRNRFVAIVGKSGCGKSTLLRLAAGILGPTSGGIYLEGEEVTGPRAEVGMVFQFPVLLKWRKVLQNILLPLEILGRDVDEYGTQALQLIRLTGLEGFEDKYPSELSGGMQQRACICRALINDPPMLLMDEPFGSLDAITREELNFELLRIWTDKKSTILFVTHSIEEAVLLSDLVIVLSPRPATVDSVHEIDLPRPRDLETKYSKEFGGLVLKIYQRVVGT